MFGRSVREPKTSVRPPLRERHALLDRQGDRPETATITVHRKAYPGVVIKIGKEIMLVDEVISGPKTFYAKNGLIGMRPGKEAG